MGMKKNSAYIFNPLLYYGIGLLPIFLVCENLKVALIFSALIIIEIILINLIISSFKPLIMHNVRIPIYIIMIISVIYVIDSIAIKVVPNLYGENFAIVQVLFVSVVTLFICDYTSNEILLRNSLLVSLRVITSYAFIIITIGALVEMLGYGSIWEYELGSFEGLAFFREKAGRMVLLAIFVIIYNYIATYSLKKREIYQNLVNRYTACLSNYYDKANKTNGGQR